MWIEQIQEPGRYFFHSRKINFTFLKRKSFLGISLKASPRTMKENRAVVDSFSSPSESKGNVKNQK